MAGDNTKAKMVDHSGCSPVKVRSGATVSKVASMNLGSDVSTKVKESPSVMFKGRAPAPRMDAN